MVYLSSVEVGANGDLDLVRSCLREDERPRMLELDQHSYALIKKWEEVLFERLLSYFGVTAKVYHSPLLFLRVFGGEQSKKMALDAVCLWLERPETEPWKDGELVKRSMGQQYPCCWRLCLPSLDHEEEVMEVVTTRREVPEGVRTQIQDGSLARLFSYCNQAPRQYGVRLKGRQLHIDIAKNMLCHWERGGAKALSCRPQVPRGWRPPSPQSPPRSPILDHDHDDDPTPHRSSSRAVEPPMVSLRADQTPGPSTPPVVVVMAEPAADGWAPSPPRPPVLPGGRAPSPPRPPVLSDGWAPSPPRPPVPVSPSADDDGRGSSASPAPPAPLAPLAPDDDDDEEEAVQLAPPSPPPPSPALLTRPRPPPPAPRMMTRRRSLSEAAGASCGSEAAASVKEAAAVPASPPPAPVPVATRPKRTKAEAKKQQAVVVVGEGGSSSSSTISKEEQIKAKEERVKARKRALEVERRRRKREEALLAKSSAPPPTPPPMLVLVREALVIEEGEEEDLEEEEADLSGVLLGRCRSCSSSEEAGTTNESTGGSSSSEDAVSSIDSSEGKRARRGAAKRGRKRGRAEQDEEEEDEERGKKKRQAVVGKGKARQQAGTATAPPAAAAAEDDEGERRRRLERAARFNMEDLKRQVKQLFLHRFDHLTDEDVVVVDEEDGLPNGWYDELADTFIDAPETVVLHGTRSDYATSILRNNFDLDKISGGGDEGGFERVFYFATDPGVADRWRKSDDVVGDDVWGHCLVSSLLWVAGSTTKLSGCTGGTIKVQSNNAKLLQPLFRLKYRPPARHLQTFMDHTATSKCKLEQEPGLLEAHILEHAISIRGELTMDLLQTHFR